MISFTAKYFNNHDTLDELGLYVQDVGGYFETHRGYVVEFFVPVEYRDFMIIKYPFLEEIEYII